MSENKEQHLPELLAPAGGFEQLFYALYFGADAVYLATDKFGLRQRAQNFTLEDMPRAVQMAHDAGAKVYVTCNAYLHDVDFAELPAYLEALDAAGVDAIIVSELGVLSYVKQYAPHVDIHVSTQASVSNTAAARMWHELGAKRIVVAREMSMAEIAALKRELPEVELEVFVQGAMCMAISGRCLISDYMTGRSANQGHCVQPCRWGYRLEEESRPGQYFAVEEDGHGTYLMNSKDLNMLAHIDNLIAAGVDSIKIEGRVKKAFYVATVVNAYRHVLDGEDPALWAEELNCISHRPYSTGFFYGDAEQSYDDDIYVQLYDWVAEVIESQPLNDATGEVDATGSEAAGAAAARQGAEGLYRTLVYCRNRFYPGDELELLSPHAPVTKIPIENLKEAFFTSEEPPADAAEGLPDEPIADVGYLVNEVPAEVANKAMGVYSFTTRMPLNPHDILRAKRKDPSKKN